MVETSAVYSIDSEVIEKAVREMVNIKEESPDLGIPARFFNAYNSKEMREFCQATAEYCTLLF